MVERVRGVSSRNDAMLRRGEDGVCTPHRSTFSSSWESSGNAHSSARIRQRVLFGRWWKKRMENFEFGGGWIWEENSGVFSSPPGPGIRLRRTAEHEAKRRRTSTESATLYPCERAWRSRTSSPAWLASPPHPCSGPACYVFFFRVKEKVRRVDLSEKKTKTSRAPRSSAGYDTCARTGSE